MKKKQKKKDIQEYLIEDLLDQQAIESGSKIRINENIDWYYTPCNYTEDERLTKLKKE